MRKILKAIHNMFLRIGIHISFVKKEPNIDPIKYNSKENLDNFWKDKKHLDILNSKEYQENYKDITDFLKKEKIRIDGKHVADVGCGAGDLLKAIDSTFSPESLTGFEPVETPLILAKKNIEKANFKIYDIYEPPTEKFDVIFCTEVLEHLLYPEKALKNLLEMTKKGGVTIVTIPNGRYDTFIGHINFWSPESWNVFLEKNTNGRKFITHLLKRRSIYTIIYS